MTIPARCSIRDEPRCQQVFNRQRPPLHHAGLPPEAGWVSTSRANERVKTATLGGKRLEEPKFNGQTIRLHDSRSFRFEEDSDGTSPVVPTGLGNDQSHGQRKACRGSGSLRAVPPHPSSPWPFGEPENALGTPTDVGTTAARNGRTLMGCRRPAPGVQWTSTNSLELRNAQKTS